MSTNELFSLDEFFTSIINRSFWGKKSIVHEYPQLNPLIQHYRKELAAQYASYMESEAKLQFRKTYECECSMKVGKDFYKTIWDIDAALRVIFKNSFPPNQIEVSVIAPYIDAKEIHNDRLTYALTNEAPIILASHPHTTQKLIIIDGNHRVYARFTRASPHTKVFAFILPVEQTLEAMTHDVFRTLYKLHHNISLISNYMQGTYENPAKDLLPI